MASEVGALYRELKLFLVKYAMPALTDWASSLPFMYWKVRDSSRQLHNANSGLLIFCYKIKSFCFVLFLNNTYIYFSKIMW